MEFKLNTKDFEKVLSQLIPVVPTSTPLYSAEHFLLIVRDNLLTIYATDLNISYHSTIPVISPDEISVAVPAKLLYDTVRNLPDSDIKITVEDSGHKLTIHTDTGKFVLTYLDASEFPKFPHFDPVVNFTINGKRLKKALEFTEVAYAKDEQRLAMTGVLFDIKPDKIVFVSTDGHKLVKYTCTDIATEIDTKIIIPGKSVNILSKLLDDKDVQVAVGNQMVKFEINGNVFTTRLIDDTYPNYEGVIPLENDYVLKVDRATFLKILKRVSFYTSSKSRQIKLQIKEDTLTITAENIEVGSQAQEKMLCDYTGQELVIAFKVDLLTDLVGVLETEEIVMRLSNALRPCIFEPDVQEENQDLTMLVMPMRINV